MKERTHLIRPIGHAPLFLMAFLIVIVTFFCSCTTDAPRTTKVNGVTAVQTDHRFLGVKTWTKNKEMKTKEQKLDDLAVDGERRKQENKLITAERQKTAAFWGGIIFFGLAVAFVFAGYFLQGWKFFGGAALVSFCLGVASWSFESLVPYLPYLGGGIGAAVVLWTMWKLKDFNLLDKLKNSEPGKIV